MTRAAEVALASRRRRGAAPTVVSDNVLMLLWRLAAPGVCRVVADPTLLRRLLVRYPTAEITRIVGRMAQVGGRCT